MLNRIVACPVLRSIHLSCQQNNHSILLVCYYFENGGFVSHYVICHVYICYHLNCLLFSKSMIKKDFKFSLLKVASACVLTCNKPYIIQYVTRLACQKCPPFPSLHKYSTVAFLHIVESCNFLALIL